MSPLIIVIIIFNLIWSLYLTYLVYKKIVNKTQKPNSDNTNISSVFDASLISNCLQKYSVIRFNPFDDLGGDQSFCMALLDKNNSGVIITSLHNRDNTRIYAKPIKNGEGDGIALSREEKMVVSKAIKG